MINISLELTWLFTFWLKLILAFLEFITPTGTCLDCPPATTTQITRKWTQNHARHTDSQRPRTQAEYIVRSVQWSVDQQTWVTRAVHCSRSFVNTVLTLCNKRSAINHNVMQCIERRCRLDITAQSGCHDNLIPCSSVSKKQWRPYC